MGIGESVTLASFLLFYFTFSFLVVTAVMESRILGRIWRRNAPPRHAETLRVVSNRLVLFFLYGVIPVILIPRLFGVSLTGLGAALPGDWISIGAMVLLSGVAVLVALTNPRRRQVTAEYPMIRLAEWSGATVLANALSWTLYLLAYEFMFRGLLLYSLVPLGVPLAIAVNVSLYVTTHLVKNLQEGIASFPFGILLCGLTLYSGSFVPAFVIHLALALATTHGSLALHPRMSIKMGRQRKGPFSDEIIPRGSTE
ncbi:MAG: type II CAAX prenyl endopeptidase Rce1 family protein [Spirochaetaceae bacterium]